MSKEFSFKSSINIHITNIIGAGATQLLISLLPKIELNKNVFIENIYLPHKGILSNYTPINSGTIIEVYQRFFPNGLSRLLESTIFSFRFNKNAPLLVLGDLPLRVTCKQTLFVQTPHLIKPKKVELTFQYFKFLILRLIFRLNKDRVNAFIVQTETMRIGLEKTYPSIKGKVHIIGQPPPFWLLSCGVNRNGRRNIDSRLKLIYPAANYAHKNHKILSSIINPNDWPVKSLVLTIDDKYNLAKSISWIKCVGFLSHNDIINEYASVDAVVFLSKEESYGFPLVEAMFVGIPIICSDLPYARDLCGDQAIYFDSDSSQSLFDAINMLKLKLAKGWWPNWKDRLNNIPLNWESVAKKMIEVTLS